MNYVVRNLKTKCYGVFESNRRVIWHTRRCFGTHFDSRDQAEDKIAELGLVRDNYEIVNVGKYPIERAC